MRHSLKGIGLTDGEIRVYISLLELGKSTAGPIINRSKISPSKIYDVLNRLIDKGLVSYMTKGKVKVFAASHPNRILDFVEQEKAELEAQESKVKEALPALEKLFKEKAEETSAEILEGARGIKSFFEMSLEIPKRGDEILVAGYPTEASKLFHAYFRHFHRRMPRKGIKGRVIYTYDAWHFKKRGKRALTKQRYLPKGIQTPAFIYIFCDYVGTIIITEKQKLCFVIKNAEVAKSYRNYFELMWKLSKETQK